MHGTTSHDREPHVVTIRVRRRSAPLIGLVIVMALLPFLGGSGSAPAARVLLAAGAPAAAPGPAQGTAPDDAGSSAAGGGPAAPGIQAADTTAAVAGALEQIAAGADVFLFPSLALAAGQPVSAQPATAGHSGLGWPLHGPEASGFGPRIHPVLGRPMFHTGIDLMAACGTPIHAAADGEVVYAAITPSWGRRVIIRHSTSLETGYAHMSRFLVQQGDVVKRGQVIGLVGTTGWSTGCHLHFDVILDGNYVDPAPYLGLPSTSTEEVPYHAAPHLESGAPGTPLRVVEDGDVPVTAAVPSRTPLTRTPTTTTSGTQGATPASSPTPPAATTSEPTTSSPSTTVPSPSSSTMVPSGSPTTTTQPPTTSASTSPATTSPATATATGSTSTTSSPSSSSPPTTSTAPTTASPTGSTPCDCVTDTTQATPVEPPTTTSTTASATETVAATTQALLATGTGDGQG